MSYTLRDYQRGQRTTVGRVRHTGRDGDGHHAAEWFNKKALIIVILIAASIVIVRDYAAANDQLATATINHTKAVCDRAHSEDNGASEEECGRLQDATNTEYLCNANVTDCWLELK